MVVKKGESLTDIINIPPQIGGLAFRSILYDFLNHGSSFYKPGIQPLYEKARELINFDQEYAHIVCNALLRNGKVVRDVPTPKEWADLKEVRRQRILDAEAAAEFQKSSGLPSHDKNITAGELVYG